MALVFVGGALGSLARYGLVLVLPGLWGVLVANTLGSFALGWFLGRRPPTRLRLLGATGFLGGFTTYSAFAFDVASLGAVRGPAFALALGGLAVAVGFVAALLGFAIADARHPRPLGEGAAR